ncbi:MAG: hypothetical protein IPI54_00055 [Chitinophagaceae bacterium]|nr:hypothetical protein [Chitinophagaceae bacterium]
MIISVTKTNKLTPIPANKNIFDRIRNQQPGGFLFFLKDHIHSRKKVQALGNHAKAKIISATLDETSFEMP